jgi:phage-related protein
MLEAERWVIEFYEIENDRCPTAEFLDGLFPDSRRLVIKGLERLAQYGTELGRPYVGYLRDHIRELRIATNQGRCRILFFQDGPRLVMLQGLIKKTGRVPDFEIDKAVGYRKSYLTRKRRAAR